MKQIKFGHSRMLTTNRLIASFLAGCLSGHVAEAQIGVSSAPMPGPDVVSCTNLDLKKQVPCPDTTMDFFEGRALVERAFHTQDFQRLDSLYTQWCTGQDRFPDGLWKLSQYAAGLDQLFSAWDAWNKHLEVIKKWQRSNPTSTAALLSEAVYWRAYAWKARGTSYARSVSKEGWELYRERLSRSKEVLDRLKASDVSCSAPYPTMISVDFELGAKEPELRAIFSEAVRKYPEYHNIYFAMARIHEPKWGGSAAKYELFANEAAELAKGFEGMGMYARIYWLVDYIGGIPFDQTTSQPPNWNKLKTGYEILTRRYPSSLRNLGKYAGVACRTRDSELYRKLRSKIDGYENTAAMVDPVDVCDRRHNWQAKKQ